MVLISELLEDVSRNSRAIGARKLLVEHYISVGWLEAALDNAKELSRLAPGDPEVISSLQLLEKRPEPPAPELLKTPTKEVFVSTVPVVETREWDPRLGRYKKKDAAKGSQGPKEPSLDDLNAAKQDLTQGYTALRTKTRYVFAELLQLHALQKKAGMPQSRNMLKIETIIQGRNKSPVTKVGPPGSARSVARSVRDKPDEATNLIITDLEYAMSWVRAPYDNPSNANNDTIRDSLVKRKNTLSDALPDDLKVHCDLALMHIEHEYLERNYANTETMLCERVKDIPRQNFYVTEDNYAWDMSELVQAVSANSGVLRNPLSKEMFTPNDIRGILMHPLGKPLGALAVEQHEMSKGVRIATIEAMEKLAKVLLEDQSSDTIASRTAVDEFLAYIAIRTYNAQSRILSENSLANMETVPDLEQKAIDGLRCPANDSHTGQSYDFSIGESVRDAKGNRVCFHKTGDFIMQAAAHLRHNRGVASDPDKCVIM